MCPAAFTQGDGACILASGSKDSTIRLWRCRESQSGRYLARARYAKGVKALVVFRGAAGLPCLASASINSSIVLWDPRTHAVIATLKDPFVMSLCVYSDACGTNVLISAGMRLTINVWDLASHGFYSPFADTRLGFGAWHASRAKAGYPSW
jgi:WD40 repeat protein